MTHEYLPPVQHSLIVLAPDDMAVVVRANGRIEQYTPGTHTTCRQAAAALLIAQQIEEAERNLALALDFDPDDMTHSHDWSLDRPL